MGGANHELANKTPEQSYFTLVLEDQNYSLLNNNVQSISKMYDVLSTTIQGPDTAIETVLQKRFSRICHLNPRLINLQKVSENSIITLNFSKGIFQGFDYNYYNKSLKYAGKHIS